MLKVTETVFHSSSIATIALALALSGCFVLKGSDDDDDDDDDWCDQGGIFDDSTDCDNIDRTHDTGEWDVETEGPTSIDSAESDSDSDTDTDDDDDDGSCSFGDVVCIEPNEPDNEAWCVGNSGTYSADSCPDGYSGTCALPVGGDYTAEATAYYYTHEKTGEKICEGAGGTWTAN